MIWQLIAAIGLAVGSAVLGYKGRKDEAALERQKAESSLAQKVKVKKTDINKKATSADGGVNLSSVDYSTLNPYVEGSGSNFIKDPSLGMALVGGVIDGASMVVGSMVSSSLAKGKSTGNKVASVGGSMGSNG